MTLVAVNTWLDRLEKASRQGLLDRATPIWGVVVGKGLRDAWDSHVVLGDELLLAGL